MQRPYFCYEQMQVSATRLNRRSLGLLVITVFWLTSVVQAQVMSDVFDDNDINAEADLIVTKADNPDPVMAGSLLTYTIGVTNNGPSISRHVLLTDTLPTGISFVSASASNTRPCILLTLNTVDCKLGDLNPNDTVTVYIHVMVSPTVPDGTSIINTVHVTSQTNDPDDAYYTEPTLVSTAADLWIDKTGAGSPNGLPGSTLYFLTVYNGPGCSEDVPQICGKGGPSDALNVVVVDTLPQEKVEVEFISANCVYDINAYTVTCTEPVLPAGVNTRFDIQIRANDNAGINTNSAVVKSDTNDPDLDNNTDALMMRGKGGVDGKNGR